MKEKTNVEWPNCVSLWRFSTVLENFELDAWSQKDQPAEARRGLLNLQTVRVNCKNSWFKWNFCLIHRLFWKMETIISLRQPRSILWLNLSSHKSEKLNPVFMKFTQKASLIITQHLPNSKISTDKFRKFCQSFLWTYHDTVQNFCDKNVLMDIESLPISRISSCFYKAKS